MALEIYISGCNGDNGSRCKGCHNPELWSFDIGEDYKEFFLKYDNMIHDFDSMIENVMIFGGEPLDNDVNELSELLIKIKSTKKLIWLFTRRESIDDIPSIIKNNCDYIKLGKYDENNLCDDNINYGIKLASRNQRIIKISK